MALLAETDESNVETEPRQQAGGAVTLPAKYEHLPLLGLLLLHYRSIPVLQFVLKPTFGSSFLTNHHFNLTFDLCLFYFCF